MVIIKREGFIDYAKAISIILVVLIHIGFSAINEIVLFSMPVFFAATGYTFVCNKRSFKEGVALRFKSVMLPFWYMMLFYTLLEMVRAGLFNYASGTIALPSLANTVYGSGVLPFSGGVFDHLKEIMSYKAQPAQGVDCLLPSSCHLWFLPAMFTGYVCFILIAGASLKNHITKLLAIVLLLLIASVEVAFPELWQLPYGIGRGGIGAAFMLVGFWIREYSLLEKRSVGYYVCVSILSLLVYIAALLLGSNGSLFVRSIYGPFGAVSVVITFAGGAAGVWLLFGICKLLEHLPLERVKNFLSFTGKNVMTVYLWHMAVKFALDVIYITFLNDTDMQLLDEYKMGLLPQSSLWYMLFEAVAILAVCLFVCKLKGKRELGEA